MSKDAVKYLRDVDAAATEIAKYLNATDRITYMSSSLLQSAVERQFITIGESLRALERSNPEVAQQITDLKLIVRFRNHLVQVYEDVSNDLVWHCATHDLPRLHLVMADLIRELEDPGR